MSDTTAAVETAAFDQARPSGRPSLMSKPDRLGVAALVLALLGGLWVMAAPFIVGYQDGGQHWSHGTIDSFIVGGGVAVLALAAIIVVVAGLLVELSHVGRGAQHAAAPESAEPAE